MNPYREPIWTDDGATDWQQTPGRPCAEGYADHWYPEGSPTDAYAKKLCDGCPVLQQCGQFAIDTNEFDGIWGGMTPRQRNVHVREIKSARSRPQNRATHCKRGHAFDEENTYVDVRRRQGCRTCRNASKTASRARLKAAGDDAA